jgi:hypothetical protein
MLLELTTKSAKPSWVLSQFHSHQTQRHIGVATWSIPKTCGSVNHFIYFWSYPLARHLTATLFALLSLNSRLTNGFRAVYQHATSFLRLSSLANLPRIRCTSLATKRSTSWVATTLCHFAEERRTFCGCAGLHPAWRRGLPQGTQAQTYDVCVYIVPVYTIHT